MIPISADTKQNIFYTIYFIIIHNYEAIFYSIGIAIALLIALYRPSRPRILLMVGFIILLFTFEYNKHILEPLKEQTLQSLITERQSWRIERVIRIFFVRLLPLGLPLSGWILVIGSIVGGAFRGLRKEEQVEERKSGIKKKAQVAPRQVGTSEERKAKIP